MCVLFSLFVIATSSDLVHLEIFPVASALIGIRKFPAKMELSDIRKRQGQRDAGSRRRFSQRPKVGCRASPVGGAVAILVREIGTSEMMVALGKSEKER
ncbi:hypothetical protein NL676_002018 [Syzygium grande]|nr:hypothetical protein NL676_002018 [Syzygium grande]